MSTTLQTRADLRAAFFKLLATDQDDPSLAEHYTDATEAANRYLQQGVESAQFFVLDHVDPARWFSVFEIDNWTEHEFVGYYAILPENFLRLAGDETLSACAKANGQRWGSLIDHKDRVERERSLAYYLANDRLYLVRFCPQRPEPLYVDFHHAVDVLSTDNDDIEFAVRDRWLIVAYAAWHALHDAWPGGGQEMMQKVDANLAHWKDEIARRSRRSRKHPKLNVRRPPAPHRIR